MKIKIRFTNDDPHGFKQNKPLKYSLLILGILLFVVGAAGIIIDRFFPSFSAAFHERAGTGNMKRFLIGNLMLLGYRLLSRKDPD